MEVVIFLIFGGWLDLTENERFLRKLFKIKNDQHYNTKLFCSQKVFPKPTICLIKHKIESENQIFGSRLLNRNMTTSIIKPLEAPKEWMLYLTAGVIYFTEHAYIPIWYLLAINYDMPSGATECAGKNRW